MSQLNKNSEESQFELMTQCGIDLHLTYTNLTSLSFRQRRVADETSQPQALSHSLSRLTHSQLLKSHLIDLKYSTPSTLGRQNQNQYLVFMHANQRCKEH